MGTHSNKLWPLYRGPKVGVGTHSNKLWPLYRGPKVGVGTHSNKLWPLYRGLKVGGGHSFARLQHSFHGVWLHFWRTRVGVYIGCSCVQKKRRKSLPSVLLNCSLDLLFQTMIRLVTGFLEVFFFWLWFECRFDSQFASKALFHGFCVLLAFTNGS